MRELKLSQSPQNLKTKDMEGQLSKGTGRRCCKVLSTQAQEPSLNAQSPHKLAEQCMSAPMERWQVERGEPWKLPGTQVESED